MSFTDLIFSFQGRISRAQWWLCIILLLFGSQILLNTVQVVSVQTFQLPSEGPTLFTSIAALFLVIPQAAVTAKRFNDRGYGSWVTELFILVNLGAILMQSSGFLANPMEPKEHEIYLLTALSLFSLWVLVENGFLRGTQGPNQYGPDPIED